MTQATVTRPSWLRLLGWILVRPRRVFHAIAQEGAPGVWLTALLVLIGVVLPVIAAWPVSTRLARETFLKMQEEMMRNAPPGAQPPNIEQAAQFVASPLFTVVMPSVTAALGQIGSWLIWAGALYLLLVFVGTRVTFGHLFQVVVWASVPYALRGVLQAAYITASGQLIQNPGLSGLVPVPQPPTEMVTGAPPPPVMIDTQTLLLRQLLAGIDLFLVWRLVLLILGVAVVARLSTRRSALIVVGTWALFTLIGLLPIWISQMFLRSTMGVVVESP